MKKKNLTAIGNFNFNMNKKKLLTRNIYLTILNTSQNIKLITKRF